MKKRRRKIKERTKNWLAFVGGLCLWPASLLLNLILSSDLFSLPGCSQSLIWGYGRACILYILSRRLYVFYCVGCYPVNCTIMTAGTRHFLGTDSHWAETLAPRKRRQSLTSTGLHSYSIQLVLVIHKSK